MNSDQDWQSISFEDETMVVNSALIESIFDSGPTGNDVDSISASDMMQVTQNHDWVSSSGLANQYSLQNFESEIISRILSEPLDNTAITSEDLVNLSDQLLPCDLDLFQSLEQRGTSTAITSSILPAFDGSRQFSRTDVSADFNGMNSIEATTWPERNVSRGPAINTYLCPVCGNQTGRHAHYGGFSCPSCRAFFRRSVQSDSYRWFKCSAASNCKINSQSWRSCRSCRFQKCLQSGMKTEWVLDRNERHTKSEKRLFQPSEVPSPTMTSIRTSVFTNDELLQILSHVDCRKLNMSNSLLEFYSSQPTLFKQLVSAIYKKNILSYSTYMHLENKWPCTMEDFVVKDSELAVLDEEDSVTLLRANFPMLQIFIQSVIMMNHQHFKMTPLGSLLKRSLQLTPADKDHSKVVVLNEILKVANVDNKKLMANTGIDYNQVFSSPWADSLDLEQRHLQLTTEMSSWPVNPADPAKHVDKVQLFLLANIIMLGTDGVQVKDYAKVTAVQEKYMMMLHRYLKFRYREKSNSLLARGLMISSLAREAQSIRAHRLPV